MSVFTELAVVLSGMSQWWRDSHRWDRPTHTYERRDMPVEGTNAAVSTLVRVEDPDFRLWRTLGVVSDAFLLVIVVLLAIMIATAIL